MAETNLRGADLRDVRTGMRRRFAILIALFALALSVGCGVAAGVAGDLLHQLYGSEAAQSRMLGLFVGSALLVFLAVTAVAGLRFAVERVLPTVAAITGAGALLAVITGVGTGRGALAALLFLLVVVVVVALGAFARALAGAVGGLVFFLVAVSGAATGGAMGGRVTSALIAFAAVIAGRRIVAGKATHPYLVDTTARVTCRAGTSFRDADLEGARFDGARLRSCDFRGARLEGARFDSADIHLCLFDGEPPDVGEPPPRRHFRWKHAAEGPAT